ncbi:hypothetical protein [Dyadobacter bucti]|uniref:hypothetical protein n=1 Tax=Dyadobacter bucti TaxID=2572203 RepID=UPI0011099D29|nr:hypothetical protein [Dyadobacter bucti]
MENDETIDPDYLKGFNEGYVIAQHMPELAEQLSRAKGKSSRLTGIQDGRREYMVEQLRSLRPSRLQDKQADYNSPEPTHVPDRDPDKDLDR